MGLWPSEVTQHPDRDPDAPVGTEDDTDCCDSHQQHVSAERDRGPDSEKAE